MSSEKSELQEEKYASKLSCTVYQWQCFLFDFGILVASQYVLFKWITVTFLSHSGCCVEI